MSPLHKFDLLENIESLQPIHSLSAKGREATAVLKCQAFNISQLLLTASV